VVGLVLAFPNVVGDCTYTSGVGSQHIANLAGTGGYNVTGLPAAYTPGASYPLTIGGTSQNGIGGFLLYAQSYGTTTRLRLGAFAATPGSVAATKTYTQLFSGCNGATICHTQALNNDAPTSVQVTWTAPAAGSGSVLVFLLVVEDTQDGWQIPGMLVKEAGSTAPAPTATYILLPYGTATSTVATPATPGTPGTPPGTPNPTPTTTTPTTGLSVGAIVGIAVACVFVVVLVVANFVPIMVARVRGNDPKSTSTIVGAAFRATRTRMQHGGTQSKVKMYR